MSDISITPDAPPVVLEEGLPSPPPQDEPLIEMEGFHVDFLSSAVKITLPDGESKLMAYHDAIPVFREFFVSKDDDGSKAKQTIFPLGVYAIDETASSLKLGMYYPEGKQTIQYRAGKPRLSVVPNIIIIATLKKIGQELEMSGAKYYATSLNQSEISVDLKAFDSKIPYVTYLPFTNVYDDYRMCYGSNHMPRTFKNRDLRELNWYYQFLWNSPFNDDLGIRALRNSALYGDWPRWYDLLATLAETNQPFPYKEIGIAR